MKKSMLKNDFISNFIFKQKKIEAFLINLTLWSPGELLSPSLVKEFSF